MNRGLVVVLAALLGLVTLGAHAEDKGHKGSWRGGDGMKKEWAERMGLTDAQAEKLKAAIKEQRDAGKPLRRELRDAMIKLRDQVDDEASDEAIKPTLDRVRKAREAMRVHREGFEKKIADVIPAGKRAKMLLARGRMGHGRMRGHGGPMMKHRSKGMGMKGGGGPRGDHRDDHEDRPPMRDSLHDDDEAEHDDEVREIDTVD